MGAARAMKNLGIKDYDTLKASLTEKLISLSSGAAGGASLQWPIKCVFVCPIHETCERYKWVGFF